MVIVIDCKLGNSGSILSMLKKIGAPAALSSSVDSIETASHFILPGVGAFDAGMQSLRSTGLLPVLTKKVEQGVPILGICLGMQLLTESSEEGVEKGLGWIPGKTSRFRPPQSQTLRVPHMGWNYVEPQGESRLFQGVGEPWRFYFVHSYHVEPRELRYQVGSTLYGFRFCSAVQSQNIYGVQFHPEKSHNFGLRLFRNFIEL